MIWITKSKTGKNSLQKARTPKARGRTAQTLLVGLRERRLVASWRNSSKKRREFWKKTSTKKRKIFRKLLKIIRKKIWRRIRKRIWRKCELESANVRSLVALTRIYPMERSELLRKSRGKR